MKSQEHYIQRELKERKKYNRQWKEYLHEFFNGDNSREEIETFYEETKVIVESMWQEHEYHLRKQELIFSKSFGGMSNEVRNLLNRDFYIYEIWQLLEDLFEASFSKEENDSILVSLDVPLSTFKSPLEVDMCEPFTNGDVEFSKEDCAHESTDRDLAPVTHDASSESELIENSYSFTSVIKKCNPLVEDMDENSLIENFFCQVLSRSFFEVSSKFLYGRAFPVCFVPDPGGLCRKEEKSVGENDAKNRQIISFREEDIVKLDDGENMLNELSLELSEILGETNGRGQLIQFTEGVSDDVLNGLTAEFEDFLREAECLEWGASERNSNMIEDSEDELVDDSFDDSEYKMLADSLCHCYYREVISNGIYTVICSSEHLGIENIMTLAVSSLYTLSFSSALISSIDASCYHISKDTVSYFLNQHSSMKFFWLWLNFVDSELLLILFMYKWIDKVCNWLYLLLFQWFLMHFSSLKGHSVVVSELF